MDLNPDVIAAFFAGITAVVSSGIALKVERKRGEKECDKRIAAFKEGIVEGEHIVDLADHREQKQ